MKQTEPLPSCEVVMSSRSTVVWAHPTPCLPRLPFRLGLIRCLRASPPPNRQGLPRSLCIPEYMPLHITPASHAVALSVSSLHVIKFDPSESLFACTFMTTLDWIRLNAAACIPPRFLSEPLSPGFSENLLPVRLQIKLTILLAGTFQPAG
jgi:hypothetical protein